MPLIMPSGRKIKVLNIHWGFIPGGVSKYAELIEGVRFYAPIRMKSICINSYKWPLDNNAAANIGMLFIYISGRLDTSWIRNTRRIIWQENPDLIFTHGFNGVFASLLASINLQIPIVTSWHGKYVGTTLPQKIRAPLYNKLSFFLFKYFVHQIVTVSDYSKNLLFKESIDEHKIKRIYNGIRPLSDNSNRSCQIVNCCRDLNTNLLIGTACRLDITKDLATLLKAVSIVVKKINNIEFTICGEGPLKNKLIKQAQELGITDYIKFAGYERDIESWLGKLDVFVLSSKLENFSIAILEAMRAGLAIVATNIGGNPEAVENNKHALLVPVGNPTALAEAIIKLAQDRKLLNDIAASAQQRFNEYFIDKKMQRETAAWLMNCSSAD